MGMCNRILITKTYCLFHIMTKRFAVYFSPGKHTELGQFGQSILCRSPILARQPDASSTFTDQARWLQLTAKPAHYGFHATLKAPFELSDAQTEEGLISAVADFAINRSSVELTTLYPRSLGGFMALTIGNDIEPLSRFAFDCVESFELFRKALSDSDVQRRRQQALTRRQEVLLLEYGYPYVNDEFRFHLTLSNTLSEHDHDYETWVISEYDRLVSKPPMLDRVAVFSQADRQTAFIQLAAFPLAN